MKQRSPLSSNNTGLSRLLFGLVILQPLLDVLSYWIDGSPLTLILRFGLLSSIISVGFVVSKQKQLYYLASSVSLFLWAGHLWAISEFGIQDLVSDLTNYIRVLQLPLTALSLHSCLQADPTGCDALERGMAASLGIILLVLLLSNLTGTEPHTYEDGSGILGWFSNTNSQSAILSMLFPVSLSRSLRTDRFNPFLFWGILVGGCAALYGIGTRLAYFAMLATLFGLGIAMWIEQRFKALSVMLGIMVLLALLTPISPMAQHQKLYYSVQADRQTQIDSALSQYDLPALDEAGLSDDALAARQALWVEALTPIYTLYAPDFVSYFGAERTIALCDYSAVIGDITELRPKKLMFARLLMEDSPISARLFGLELSRFTVGDQNYDVENDFHGIYYLYGIIGLFCLLLFLGVFLFPLMQAFLRHPLQALTADRIAWSIALGCCLLHAVFTAGVLRRPNASFYLAVCLAVLRQKRLP